MSQFESEEKAVGRFGLADRFARRFDRFGFLFRLLLILCSLATVCVGLWLISVIVFILPSRDPGHIALWRWVTLGFFAYSALTLLYLFRGPRVVWLRSIVLLASLVAIAAGLYGIVNMIQVARSGGHFEGYIILMGLVLCGHGLTALVYTFLSNRVARVVGAV